MKKYHIRALVATCFAFLSQTLLIGSATAETLKVLTTGAFKQVVVAVASDYEKRTGHKIDIQNDTAGAVTKRVTEGESFDVLVATNFYGDILSDLCSEMSGSLGLAGSVMASDDLCCAQAQHGSAPTIAGKDIANPTSMILSVAMMVRWVGDQKKNPALQAAGDAMTAAVDMALANPSTRTPDIGGTMGCKAFAAAVADAVAKV